MPFAEKQYRRAIFAVSLVVIASLVASSISNGARKKTSADAGKNAADEKTISALIQQLGDESFEKRELAGKRLAAIGAPALSLLEKAAEDGPDLETRTRAAAVIRVITQSTAGDGPRPGYVRQRLPMIGVLVRPPFTPPPGLKGPLLVPPALTDSGFLRHKAVQDELKLSVEQIAKVNDLQKELRKAIAAFNKDGLDYVVVVLKINKIMPKWEKAAADLLTPAQLKRFQQIRLQLAVPSGFLDPEVAEALKLTAEQKQSVRTVYNDGRREWYRDFLKRKAKRDEMREYDAATTKKIMEFLSEAQKREYANMTGEIFRRQDELPLASHPALKSVPKKK